MKTSTCDGKYGIKWTAQNQLEELEFADDPVIQFHTHEQMQVKTNSEAASSALLCLNIHKGQSKILKYNKESTNQITLDGETLEDVESFTYLISMIDERGGSDADVEVSIGKAWTAFLQLKNIWNSKQLSTNTKVRIFNTNVKTFLLTIIIVRSVLVLQCSVLDTI
ncbi:unnamed protein product [Schistosoma margrebowiei]|uniref:Uncharacterized protein n=1 Tax=Schistosoma margrebowiei TaxID=48269 RepID=A0A183MZ43_9TREM|nr:unnamed protein product [Schistosoma margrebowiei]